MITGCDGPPQSRGQEAPIDGSPTELTPERRALLARKGEILYGKSCGTRGSVTCAERFARHQLRLGHVEVVHDLLRFLDARGAELRGHDPDGLLAMTEGLAASIRRHLTAGQVQR